MDVAVSPRYSMPQPAEWSALLEAAEDALETSGTPQEVTQTSAETMYQTVQNLDNEQLEENRYYALGLVMCGLGKILHDPDLRSKLVQHSAHRMFASYKEYRVDDAGFRPYNIETIAINTTFREPLHQIQNQTPHARRFLQDTLQVAAERRNCPIQPDEDGEFSAERLLADDINRITKGHVMSDMVARNASSATINALFVAYRALVPEPEPENGERYNPSYHDKPLDIDLLKGLDIKRLSTALARLRLDEFAVAEYRDKMLVVDDDGAVSLPRRNVPDTPPPLGSIVSSPPWLSRKPLHENRLGCPALFVHKLVPGMLAFVIDVIEATDQRAAAEKIERERYYSMLHSRTFEPHRVVSMSF